MKTNIVLSKEIKDYAKINKINISKFVESMLYAHKHIHDNNFISGNQSNFLAWGAGNLSSNLSGPTFI